MGGKVSLMDKRRGREGPLENGEGVGGNGKFGCSCVYKKKGGAILGDLGG